MTNFLFREIEIIGEENLPKEGPVIIVCNHNSQFVDAALLFQLKRKINFIIAAASTKLKVLSFFLKFTGFIPTNRPMDKQREGEGRLVNLKNGKLFGNGTYFTKLKYNDHIIPVKNKKLNIRVKQIISETELIYHEDEDIKNTDLQDSEFHIQPKLDNSQTYANVFKTLMKNEVIGIFPEGGSHDRTEMLPVKPGACIFIYECKKQFNKNVPMVPIGLTYFGAHKFRSRVILKIGKPIKFEFNEDKINDSEFKKQKIQDMMQDMENGMKNCLINAPTYEEKKNLIYACEIYIPDDFVLSSKEKFTIYKKFSIGYDKLKSSDKMKEFNEKINSFRKKLKQYNLTIKDLKNLQITFQQNFKQYIKELLILSVFSLPFMMMYIPMRFIMALIIKKKKKDELNWPGNIKIRANDIVQSVRLTYGLVLTMIFLLFLGTIYFIILYVYFNIGFFFSLRLQFDFWFWFPVYCYYAVNFYDVQKDYIRIIWFRIKLYIFFKNSEAEEIKLLLQKRYELQKEMKQILQINEFQQEIKGLLEKKLIPDELQDDQRIEDQIKKVVSQVENEFENFLQIIFNKLRLNE